MVVNFILIDRLYFPKSKRRDFYFTYMLTSVAVFFLMFFMMSMKAKATMGIGIGLFGIFSIMRFRTDAMPVREMTYLFLIISLSVISAISGDKEGFDLERIIELILTDCIIILITWICEKFLKVKSAKLIQYDRVELTKPERYAELVEDVVNRTGLDVIKIEVGGIDFLKDTVVLKVYYNPIAHSRSNTVSDQFRITRTQFRDM
ncbi:MAG: DUF4956 domain-containing protein [Prevotella sp.]